MKRSRQQASTPTLRDVAHEARVSITTASLVLNGKAEGSIRPDTSERVLAAARSLQYRPNAMARSLRTQKSMTLGMVSDEIATTPFAGAMIQGVQELAADHGYLVLLVNTGDDPEIERRSIENLVDRQIDGLIYATMFHREISVPAVGGALPLVLLDARPVPVREASPAICSVTPDEAGGARSAVEHLLQVGHRRIGFVQNADPIPAADERLIGYKQALEHAGIAFDPALVVADRDRAGLVATAAARSLLDRPDAPTALFCFNDRFAAGAYRACRALGLRVPEDVSIVGFDNQRLIVEFLEPMLTTVQLPHYEMGVWAAQQLIASIADPDHPATALRMACPLVIGKSVAPPGAPIVG